MFVFLTHIQMNKVDRPQLGQFHGQQVSFKGLVVSTKCPTSDQKFICLRKINVGTHGESTSCHHLWMDVSHITGFKVRLADWITGCAYIKHYVRRDGSESYGLCHASNLSPA